MSVFDLDGISLSVRTYSGFDLPDDVSVVNILGDGTSRFNAVLQSPGTRLPTADLTGRETDYSVIQALRALRSSESQVTFTDSSDITRTVVVTSLRVSRAVPEEFIYAWSATLVALEETD